MRLGVPFHPERRVAGRHFSEAPGQDILIPMGSRFNRNRHQRLRHLPRLDQQRNSLAETVSPVSAGPVSSGRRCPRPRCRHRPEAGSQRRIEMGDTLVAVMIFDGPGPPARARPRGLPCLPAASRKRCGPGRRGQGRGLSSCAPPRRAAAPAGSQSGGRAAFRRREAHRRLPLFRAWGTPGSGPPAAQPGRRRSRRKWPPPDGRNRARPPSPSHRPGSGGISSPPRYRSINVSSSLSAMIPSMSAPRAASDAARSTSSVSRHSGRHLRRTDPKRFPRAGPVSGHPAGRTTGR